MDPWVDAPRRAVVIEDDADIASLVEFALSSMGFEVHVAGDGPTGIDLVGRVSPDLITLDVGLPGIDGLEVCRRLRPITDAYLIMVTALGEEVDRLMGLETGADDYLIKPISVRELKVRVNVLFRRPRQLVTAGSGEPAGSVGSVAAPAAGGLALAAASTASDTHEVLRHGGLEVDVDGHRAWCEGEELRLTPIEFRLLTELMRAPSRVWSRELLLEKVWGPEWAETHLVEVHMGNLRRKLGDRRGRVRFVENVRGVGYRMLDAS